MLEDMPEDAFATYFIYCWFNKESNFHDVCVLAIYFMRVIESSHALLASVSNLGHRAIALAHRFSCRTRFLPSLLIVLPTAFTKTHLFRCQGNAMCVNPHSCMPHYHNCKKKKQIVIALTQKCKVFIMPFMLVIKLGLVAMETTIYSTTSSDWEVWMCIWERKEKRKPALSLLFFFFY